MTFRRIALMLFVGLLMLVSLPTTAQNIDDIVALTVETGFNQHFRPDYWLPVRVNVRNEGDSITGRLTVRPDTSGRVVSNAYSTPIDLPTGSEKTAFLYLQARTFPPEITVELLDHEGVRIAEQRANLRVLDPHDALHVVVSRIGADSIALNGVVSGGYDAFTARWEAAQLPPAAMALEAVDTLTFYDVNSNDLTVGQREAVSDWVAMGGHLVVIGGARWQETSATFADILPFIPDDGQSVNDVQGLATFAGHTHTNLSGRTFIAVGAVQENARVLAETSAGLPLLVRGQYGSGTVDFLAADPTQTPLRNWNGLRDFWFTLFSSTRPQPGWTLGFLETQDAARAIAILPDVELLPPVTSMIAYIMAYIFLIGPLNYFILSRLNRREWAWFSIPLFIVVFSGLAWTVGFNLRGSEVFVSRLNVVQSFVDSDVARLDQLIGILSPRRDTYTMTVPAGRFIRVMPGLAQGNFLQQNSSQSTADIVQQDDFTVENISIDGGIFANFSTTGVTEAPAISGSVILIYNPDITKETAMETQSVRGVVRNDSALTLEDAVIITRNAFYPLPDPLAPGDVVNFDSANMGLIRDTTNELLPHGSPFELVYALELGNNYRNSSPTFRSLESSRVVMGDSLQLSIRRTEQAQMNDEEETLRRRALLRSFMRDQFNASGIGHGAYLIGWSTDELPPDIVLGDVPYRSIDSVLHIVQLATTVEKPASSDLVTIEGDQFTWTVRERDTSLAIGGINDLTLINPGFIDIRFQPLEDAVLREVETLTVVLDRSSSYGRDVTVSLWDWEREDWVDLLNSVIETYEVEDPQRFIGANGMVDMRLSIDREIVGSTASARIRDLKMMMTGYF